MPIVNSLENVSLYRFYFISSYHPLTCFCSRSCCYRHKGS
nr:MAG TPA: hypothetical protein [Caudoviricetes sp.]